MSILSAAAWMRASVVVASFRLRLFAIEEARASAVNGGLIQRRRYSFPLFTLTISSDVCLAGATFHACDARLESVGHAYPYP